jgi:hypothetical protein
MGHNEMLIPVGDSVSAVELLIRLLLNLVAITLLVRVIYYPLHRQKDYLFTFFLFNLLIFMMCLLLSTARIKLGFAFGLFAVFSIMRYRTVVIPIKEMGYFFTCVALGIFNALVSNEGNYALLLMANVLILLLVFVLDRYITLNHEQSKEILYERIDLIRPADRAALIADLVARTGLQVHRVEVVSIDFLKDTATIRVFYYGRAGE